MCYLNTTIYGVTSLDGGGASKVAPLSRKSGPQDTARYPTPTGQVYTRASAYHAQTLA